MSAPAVADMRVLLGLGPEISDAAVVDAYVASLGFDVLVMPAPAAPDDPFARAAAALFRSPVSTAATYATPDGVSIPVRAIKSTSPVDVIVGSRSIEAGATIIDLLRDEFEAEDFEPEAGGSIVIDDVVWQIMGKPRLDVEGVSWSCEAAEA